MNQRREAWLHQLGYMAPLGPVGKDEGWNALVGAHLSCWHPNLLWCMQGVHGLVSCTSDICGSSQSFRGLHILSIEMCYRLALRHPCCSSKSKMHWVCSGVPLGVCTGGWT